MQAPLSCQESAKELAYIGNETIFTPGWNSKPVARGRLRHGALHGQKPAHAGF